MTKLEVALTARAFRDGRAKRSALVRHRRLIDDPLALVIWQLGAEPFSAAAIGFGSRCADLEFVVAGEPRNRDLAFAALLRFARWFNIRFEAPAIDRETIYRGDYAFSLARSSPQVIVANEATIEMLGRLGRRLAYLPLVGPHPAAPELVRLGQHLSFVSRHASTPGQQLIVSMTELLGRHWVTPQSAMEQLSLAALDAFIEPPAGVHGFYAAASKEKDVTGPVPTGEDDDMLEPLLEEFNRRRAGSTDPAIVSLLLSEIEAHYRPLVERTWALLWKCRDREANLCEALSVGRRWDVDREAYTMHIDWTSRDGRRRTRQTARQAAMLLRQLEDANRLLNAEEACDDALRMVPHILDGNAVIGQVMRIDENYREVVRTRRMRRTLVTIASTDLCLMPRGKELWWTKTRDGRPYVVHEVRPISQGGSRVTLKLSTSSNVLLPRVGEQVCFSIHTTATQWMPVLPTNSPWTHVARVSTAPPAPIEGEEG